MLLGFVSLPVELYKITGVFKRFSGIVKQSDNSIHFPFVTPNFIMNTYPESLFIFIYALTYSNKVFVQ